MRKLLLLLVLTCGVAACFEDKDTQRYWDTYQQRAAQWRTCVENNLDNCGKYKTLMDQAETEYRLKKAQ
jgi:hypothetical protein